MGLLDDAIREHLELKRKHGADPEEVERLELEALHADEVEAPQEQPPEAEEQPLAAAEIVTPEQDEEYEEAIEAEAVMVEEEVPLGVEMVSEEPPPVVSPKLQETVEIDEIDFAPPAEKVEDVSLESDDEPKISEGILDKTPDFLEDTPEHDRLWFEQKQPKDFDFEG